MEEYKINYRYLIMGVSVFLIFMYHISLYSYEYFHVQNKFLSLFRYGNIGVDFFLFLSSYGLCHSLEANTKLRYYLNRIKRIIPLYLLFLIGITIVWYHTKGAEWAIKTIIYQLSGLANFHAFDFNIEWYLTALIVLYAIFPILYYLLTKISKWEIQSIIFVFLCIYICNHLAYSNKIEPQFTTRIPIFIIGSLFYINKTNRNAIAIIIIASLFCSLVIDNITLSNSLLVPAIIFALNETCLRENKVIEYLGKHSLEIYLANHFATMYLMERLVSLNIYWAYIIVLSTTVIISILFIIFQRISNEILFSK